MAERLKTCCAYPGCGNLVSRDRRFCAELHDAQEQERIRRIETRSDRRLSPTKRGYDNRWRRYAKTFLARPENRFCKLHLDSGCAIVAQCVDHIDPPDGPNDPRFWDRSNHQPACIHCNSVKNHTRRVGTFVFGLTDET